MRRPGSVTARLYRWPFLSPRIEFSKIVVRPIVPAWLVPQKCHQCDGVVLWTTGGRAPAMFAKAAPPATTGGPGTAGGHSPRLAWMVANNDRCAGWVFNRHTWPGCCPGGRPEPSGNLPAWSLAESGVTRLDRVSQAEERPGRVA